MGMHLSVPDLIAYVVFFKNNSKYLRINLTLVGVEQK